MLLLTFFHGLRASEVCHLRRQDVDLTHGRIWMARLTGSLSTDQPLWPQALRQRPVSEINQQA
jgi:integrase